MPNKALGSTLIFLAVLIPSVAVLTYSNSGSLIPNPHVEDCNGPINSICIGRVGNKVANFLIQKINTDTVEGTIYYLYPLAYEGVPKTLLVGEVIGYACDGTLTKLTSINYANQTLIFTKQVNGSIGACPICLSGDTLIDTPEGKISIKELKVGMPVYTVDKYGQKQVAVILNVSRTEVPSTHFMVDLVLGDGRELFASPRHPTADGRIFGNVRIGDIVDHSIVKDVKIVPYGQRYTFDILPSGDTGFYWANGILVGSTLKNS